jgi:carbohydrate-binding DOMON domain-containing protein
MRYLVSAAVAFFVLALIAPALAAAPDCTTNPCTYIPLALKPPSGAPEPTSSATHTATATATRTATPTNTRTPSPTATQQTNCAAEYPTVCIPPPPPDLNCADIPYRNFTVLPPDRHRFDTDHDGIGCEQ